jgi:hypothetical protein
MDANVTAIIVGLIASIPGIIAIWRQWKIDEREQPREDVTASMQASQTAAEIVEKYSKELIALRQAMAQQQAEIDELRKRLEEQEHIHISWREGIKRLTAQIISLGHPPVWKIPTGPLDKE